MASRVLEERDNSIDIDCQSGAGGGHHARRRQKGENNATMVSDSIISFSFWFRPCSCSGCIVSVPETQSAEFGSNQRLLPIMALRLWWTMVGADTVDLNIRAGSLSPAIPVGVIISDDRAQEERE